MPVFTGMTDIRSSQWVERSVTHSYADHQKYEEYETYRWTCQRQTIHHPGSTAACRCWAKPNNAKVTASNTNELKANDQ